MNKTIGLRREDKNKWEKRVPIIPEDVEALIGEHNFKVTVQPSEIRVFRDKEYKTRGAEIDESLSDADVVFAVKEIPVQLLEAEKAYVFFSHTIKGQPYNMGMLKKLMELKCSLIDYEKMSDSNGARLITFSPFAGMAGTIESLHAFARKKEIQGIKTPFKTLQQAFQYNSINEAETAIQEIGKEISINGISSELHPLTIGIAGYGNVAKGVHQILDLLPIQDITPDQLREGLAGEDLDNKYIYRIVFKEEDLVQRHQGEFDLQEYYQNPENYRSIFHQYFPEPQILLNCVYWTESYPKFVTREKLKKHFKGVSVRGLQIIGDISCDIGGAVEITRDATKPDSACYTYFPQEEKFETEISDGGITVMAIDNLPCEFPREASSFFSSALKEYVGAIAAADYNVNYEELELPEDVKKAVILLGGELTPDYKYLEEFLQYGK